MRFITMEGGYINEGGQLKTKNGQKYIINHRPEGFYISKSHAILLGLLTLIVMAAAFLLTYFLLSHSSSCSTVTSRQNSPDAIKQAGIFNFNRDVNDSILADQPSYQKIVLKEGWSPIIYKLVIQPDIANGTSTGQATIDVIKDFNITEILPIILDINNITITEAQVFQNSSGILSPLNIKTYYGDRNETFVIDLENVNKSENITLQIRLKFISRLSETLQGFYKVSYEDTETGEKAWLASTQFSPIDARRAFPCFDRPDKKAQFQISIKREKQKTMTLSNMPRSSISDAENGYVKEDFEITPKMSTYLVAFIVSDLVNTNVSKNIQPITKLPEINIWTRKEVADMTNYAYGFITKALPFFEQYFAIPFQLPKIDMVAVPDFGFQAMENWGLITFRESAILVPENESLRSSAEHTEAVSSVIAHELAHQWFGNLVTMKWWDDLWLKEGFANYLSYIALDHIEPSWNVMDFISIYELQKAMARDTGHSAHPISFPVESSLDIRRIFDPISYSKGASIIRMAHNFIGQHAFKESLQQYLKKFEYSNAVRNDLWQIMTENGQKYGTLPKELNVQEIMKSWTEQSGYPVVTVQREGVNVHISQQRYSLPKVDVNDQTRWYIPITYETQANRTQVVTPSYWLNNSTNITLYNIVDLEHWFYLNIKRNGYYRVNYDHSSWVILAKKYDDIPPVIQAQLIDDVLNLARAEIVSYDVPLFFLLKLRSEDYLPWAAAKNGIAYLTYMLIREPAYEYFRALMRFMIKPIYEKMGFDELPNESHVQLRHRERILKQACFFNFDRCTNRAQIIYREWMRDKSQNLISPNLKEVVYCTALREGSYQEWYFAYNRYLETTSASEKESILSALGCTTKSWLLSKYLNMTITATSGIRKQDGARAFTSVARNHVGYEIAFDFLVSNIQEISEYFGDGFQTLSKMVNSITTYMNKDYQKDQLIKFETKAEALGLKTVKFSIRDAIEKVDQNIFWRSRSYYQLQGFLEKLTHELNINLY